VSGNPVDGVKRPMANGNEGSTHVLVMPRRHPARLLFPTIFAGRLPQPIPVTPSVSL
jgi:hypothetical protein